MSGPHAMRLRQALDTPQTPAVRGRFIRLRPTHAALLLLHLTHTRCNNDKTQDSLSYFSLVYMASLPPGAFLLTYGFQP